MAPLLKKIGGFDWRGICTAKGLTAQSVGSEHGFAFATTDEDEVWSDPQTTAVFIATRHHLHARQVIAGLRAKKHIFVEKPLCIDEAELESIRSCIAELGESCPILMVGFNRRFSSSIQTLKNAFAGVRPVSISHRFAVPALPAGHWTQDPEVGGRRIVGEACHAVDTCVALAGSLPVRVFAESAGRVGDAEAGDDRVFITIRHQNGTVSSVSYVAGGDRAFPAERIEVVGGGRTAVVDNWDDIQLWRDGRVRRSSGSRDRGHQAELEAFLRACKEGGPSPIPWSELYSVAETTILAARSVREGVPFECGSGADLTV